MLWVNHFYKSSLGLRLRQTLSAELLSRFGLRSFVLCIGFEIAHRIQHPLIAASIGRQVWRLHAGSRQEGLGSGPKVF
jgi:hypothetical protein